MTEKDFFYADLSGENQEIVNRIYYDYADNRWLYSKDESIFFNKIKHNQKDDAEFYVDVFLLIYKGQWFTIHTLQAENDNNRIVQIKVINIYSVGEFSDELVPVIKLCLKAYMRFYYETYDDFHYSVDVLTREYANTRFAFETNLVASKEYESPDEMVIRQHGLKPYVNTSYKGPYSSIETEIALSKEIKKKQKRDKYLSEILHILLAAIIVFVIIWVLVKTDMITYVFVLMMIISKILGDFGGRGYNGKRK
ncbi:MAG: hypothetical protein IJ141_08950 [Lachnospiraceae bacterium]|nr:hypothetical protein [Lachnospiraceae bacterium]